MFQQAFPTLQPSEAQPFTMLEITGMIPTMRAAAQRALTFPRFHGMTHWYFERVPSGPEAVEGAPISQNQAGSRVPASPQTELATFLILRSPPLFMFPT